MLLLLFLISHCTSSQSIIGFVYDESSGEPLIGATIYDTLSGNGCATNLYGFFNLRSSSESVNLRISYVGYETFYGTYNSDDGKTLAIYLKNQVLDELVIYENRGLSDAVSRQIVSTKRLLSIPMLGGEPDIVKSLALLPGISQGVEGTTGLYIRGGTPDQNLVLMDEAPVYNLAHLFGFVSIFNGDAIKHVDVMKGGFSANYGGRLSSVVDVSLKEGNREKYHSEFSLGLITSRFLIEGPLKKSRNSFLLAARSSYLGLVYTPNNVLFLNSKSDYYLNYWMYDITAKVNFDLKNGGRLFISHYSGDDRWITREGDYRLDWSNYRLQWGNRTFSLRYYRPMNGKFFIKHNAYYTRYDYKTDISEIDTQTSLKNPLTKYGLLSSVEDISMNSSLEFFPKANVTIRGGVQGVWHQYAPGKVEGFASANTSSQFQQTIDALDLAFYLQNSLAVSKNFNFDAGLRFSAYLVQDTSYNRLEPRVSASYRILPTWSLRISMDKMNQFVHLLTGYSLGPSNDIWFPATSSVPPSAATQLNLGLLHEFSGWEISIEGFEKQMKGLIDYSRGLDVLESLQEGIENLLEVDGTGRVRGLEFFTQKSHGKLQGWISYTLSRNTRQFDGIDQGKEFYSNFDRRHNFSINLNYELSPFWSINSTWVYQSGRRISMPVALYLDSYNQPTFQYGGRNNFKTPDYHRLDLAVQYEKTNKRDKKRLLNLSIYNVYNRTNPFYIDFRNKQASLPDKVNYELTSNSVLQFFPSISYTWEL